MALLTHIRSLSARSAALVRHIAAACGLFLALNAQAAPLSEYDVKAVFLLNFTLFVEWPAAEGKEEKPLVVSILGEDPFGPRLDEVFRGEKVGKRHLVLNRARNLEESLASDVVFIARSEKLRALEIIERLKTLPILTVSDIPDFAGMGGMVELVNENGKVKLHINVDASKSAKLTISSKLLRPASIVTTKKTSWWNTPSFARAPLLAANYPKTIHDGTRLD